MKNKISTNHKISRPSKRRSRILGAIALLVLGFTLHSGWDFAKQNITPSLAAESHESIGDKIATLSILPRSTSLSESGARKILDAIYKGDYRNAFVQKKPELFLKHISDDFQSVSVEGNLVDRDMLRQFFTDRFKNQIKTIEHNVTIEDIDILPGGKVAAVVTLYTLEEFEKTNGEGTYLLTTIATYRDIWQKRNGTWFEISGDQLRNQTITAPRP